MKEMIDGMLYDTCTATPIGNYDNGGGRMEGIKESLFQKKTGEFFLCILAGPKTKYGDPLDKTQRMVSLIEPLDLDEARFWGELHLSPRKYAQVFDKYQDCEDVFVTGLGEGFLWKA